MHTRLSATSGELLTPEPWRWRSLDVWVGALDACLGGVNGGAVRVQAADGGAAVQVQSTNVSKCGAVHLLVQNWFAVATEMEVYSSCHQSVNVPFLDCHASGPGRRQQQQQQQGSSERVEHLSVLEHFWLTHL